MLPDSVLPLDPMAAPAPPSPDGQHPASETQPVVARPGPDGALGAEGEGPAPTDAGATREGSVDMEAYAETDADADADALPRQAPPSTATPAAVGADSGAEGVTPPAPRAMDPAACAAKLKALFPALFTGSPKPLKLRIQIDIQQRAPSVFPKTTLSAFFRRYTGSTGYLLAVAKGKNRFDLDGQPAGELSEEHRLLAQTELTRRRTNTESRVALEDQQRRNRATLLHDFERTTLTPSNFCALKNIEPEALEGYLETARREARERSQAQAAPPDRGAERPAPRMVPGLRRDRR
jgi:ProP effector